MWGILKFILIKIKHSLLKPYLLTLESIVLETQKVPKHMSLKMPCRAPWDLSPKIGLPKLQLCGHFRRAPAPGVLECVLCVFVQFKIEIRLERKVLYIYF